MLRGLSITLILLFGIPGIVAGAEADDFLPRPVAPAFSVSEAAELRAFVMGELERASLEDAAEFRFVWDGIESLFTEMKSLTHAAESIRAALPKHTPPDELSDHGESTAFAPPDRKLSGPIPALFSLHPFVERPRAPWTAGASLLPPHFLVLYHSIRNGYIRRDEPNGEHVCS